MKQPAKHFTQPSRILAAGVAALVISASGAFAQYHNISESPGLFTPSFRDLTNNDLGNTTFFGWGPGTNWSVPGSKFLFDGTTDNELIDNVPTSQGIGGLTGTLNQIGVLDVLSSSNNIYTSSVTDFYLSIQIPTNGTVGLGFTTIIVQGHTAFGPFATNTVDDFDFPALGGDIPDVVVGSNGASSGQFWAKYEIPGNAASYTLDFGLLPGFMSIAEIQVDTKWSATSYAGDFAVPEPSAALSLLGGLGFLGMIRRRRSN